MLAATGARGLRLLSETASFSRLLLSDHSSQVLSVLQANAAPFRTRGAECVLWDARIAPAREVFDYVDLDPYGTPIPFLDAALTGLQKPGILAVTATDMPVLSGVEGGPCERRYGARPIRGRLGPEGGLRILLAYLARHLALRHLSMRPLLSYVLDHHVRTYVSVTHPVDPLESIPVGMIRPEGWLGPELAGRPPFGPLWLGALFDADVVGALRLPPTAAQSKTTGILLKRFQEEVGADRPFYYESNELAAQLRLAEPPSIEDLFAGLKERGETATRTHARPAGFRTTASRQVVEEVARAASRSVSPKTHASERSFARPSGSR